MPDPEEEQKREDELIGDLDDLGPIKPPEPALPEVEPPTGDGWAGEKPLPPPDFDWENIEPPRGRQPIGFEVPASGDPMLQVPGTSWQQDPGMWEEGQAASKDMAAEPMRELLSIAERQLEIFIEMNETLKRIEDSFSEENVWGA